MTLIVTWGGGQRRPVATVAELDAALDEATDTDRPQVVGIYPPEHFNTDASPWEEELPPALQIGVGHPQRSFVLWLGPDGGVGVDPEAKPWPEGSPGIEFDYAGSPIFCGPDRAAVTPQTAREAARQFLRTCEHPGNVMGKAAE